MGLVARKGFGADNEKGKHCLARHLSQVKAFQVRVCVSVQGKALSSSNGKWAFTANLESSRKSGGIKVLNCIYPDSPIPVLSTHFFLMEG